jgi:hypothetical protein
MSRTPRAALLAVALAGCATVRPNVRDGSVPTYSFFLDRDRAFFAAPSRGVLYEGEIAPNFLLHQSFDAAFRHVSDTGRARGRRGTSVAFTPLVRLRQLRDSSAPVRAPSFMPKVTAQWLWARRERGAFFDPTRPYSPVQFLEVETVVGHYSNGQAGCAYTDQHHNPADFDDCLPHHDDAHTVRHEINGVDGDFSTHYVRLGANWRRLLVDSTRREWLAYGAGGSFEQHVPGRLVGGGMSDELRAVYGSRRLAAQAEVLVRDSAALHPLGGSSRVTLYAERALGAATWVPHARWWLEVAHTFDRAFGFGVFFRRHQGQDYYNLGFARRLNASQYGITFDLERRAFFDRPARTLPSLPSAPRP